MIPYLFSVPRTSLFTVIAVCNSALKYWWEGYFNIVLYVPIFNVKTSYGSIPFLAYDFVHGITGKKKKSHGQSEKTAAIIKAVLAVGNKCSLITQVFWFAI